MDTKEQKELPFDKERGQQLLKQMMRIRKLEQKAAEMYTKEKIRGFLHLYNGEEANAVGAIEQLREEDALFTTYREHGHALIRGVPAREIMAELYGKQEGCSRGRGGSMHLFDVSRGFYGGYAIVAGALPPAIGMALAMKRKGSEGIVACFFGEGTVAEGAFHETMNLAALWELPVLFLCENNFYAMGTALERSESVTSLPKKMLSYDIPAYTVDGMEVVEVMEGVKEGTDHVRSGNGPYFLESKTYRFRAHSMFDAQLYRSEEEVETWKEKGPIKHFRHELQEQGFLEEGEFDKLEKEAEEEMADAVAFAEQGTDEPVEDLTRYVLSENEKA